MIDTRTETLLTFSQAAKELPCLRGNKKAHALTVYRWATAGCWGVVLESIQVGGTRCTSKEAIQRFCERLTKPSGAGSQVGEVGRSQVKRKRQATKAGEQLESLGA
jgi:hypothetical protein